MLNAYTNNTDSYLINKIAICGKYELHGKCCKRVQAQYGHEQESNCKQFDRFCVLVGFVSSLAFSNASVTTVQVNPAEVSVDVGLPSIQGSVVHDEVDMYVKHTCPTRLVWRVVN